jgi:pilus assembly protein CpaB
MSRIRVFLVLALALGTGGALAYGTYNYVQGLEPRTISMPTQPVVVAAADLQIGAELKADDIRTVEWPADSVPAGAIADPEEVVGRGVIYTIIQHEPILLAKLASKEAGSGLPPAIPPGMRAVSVRVNEVIGVAGYVLPGTHVDVVATVSPSQSPQDMTAKVILTNVMVLAAGTKIERDAEDNQPMQVNVVTMLVNPEEAERLTLAANEGKIQLALRNPLDSGNPITRGVRPAWLLGTPPPVRRVEQRPTGPVVVTAPPPEPPPTVEIIRGDKRAHEVVRQEH